MEMTGTPNDDTLTGGTENDSINGLGGDDVLIGNEGRDRLDGDGGNDTLYGNGGGDLLLGNGGDDHLYGGYGANVLRGGAGDDHYYISGDWTPENEMYEDESDGFDTIHSEWFDVDLNDYANFEAVHLFGRYDADARGNDFDNVLQGSQGSNRLRGEGGNDYLISGSGGGRGGDDILIGGEGNDTLEAHDTHSVRAFGDNGDDVFDIYWITNGVFASGGEGNDTIEVMRADNLFVEGGNGDDVLTVRWSTDDVIIRGGDGNDTITLGDGRGFNLLEGGAGDDYYIYDGSKGDIIELANEGYDTVEVHNLSFTLDDNLEALEYHGSDNTVRGNDLDNVIDIYSGKGGLQVYGDGGDDLITLHDGGVSANGGAGNDTIVGSGDGDTLRGGSGNDVLRVAGNAGNATMQGDGGNDIFVLSDTGGIDILGFNGNTDRVRLAELDNIGGQGALAENYFRAGTAAQDSDDHIIFDATTGSLYYDADANGAGAQILIAMINVESGLVNHTDFTVS